MGEVSTRVPLLLLQFLEKHGQWSPSLLTGLSFDRPYLEAARGRVPWADFTLLLERVSVHCGGVSILEQAAMTVADDSSVGVLRSLLRGLPSVRSAYMIGARWWGPTLFLNTAATIEELPGRRLSQTVSIQEPHRDSLEFFHMLLGAMRVTPRLIGQGNALVDMQLVPRSATYTITLPPDLGYFRRALQLLKPDRKATEELIELVRQVNELQERYIIEQLTNERLRKQARQLREQMEHRERAEEQLQQARKMEAIGRLAGGIAHNFNNVLQIIRGYAELTQQSIALDQPCDVELDAIMRATRRGESLLRQLGGLTHRHAKGHIFSLNKLISRMQPILSHLIGDDIELTLSLCDSPTYISAIAADIEQALINLLTNARDAMPNGGQIEITTSPVNIDCADFIQLQVRDTGVGMEEDIRAKAFEPFFTTKLPERGTGLGLSTTYSMVIQRGGRMTLQSKPGTGSVVEICLPLARPPSESSALRS
jgi:signal transduction histidine kinase